MARNKRELAPVQNISKADMAVLQQSMTDALDQQYAEMSVTTKAELLKNFEDILTASFRIMQGIYLRKFDDDGEEHIYSVPPYWPAIKYFLDWFRELAKMTVAKSGRGIDSETTELLKSFLRDQEPHPSSNPTKEGGVVHLGEFRMLPDEPESHDNGYQTETDPERPEPGA